MSITAPVTHVLPLTTIRRKRVLPVFGQVLVRQGQKVIATDVIAEANLKPEHILLDVARGLGVSAEQAHQLIERQVGEFVDSGGIIANRGGSLAARMVRAPSAGMIAAIGGGKVLLETETPPYQLRAGMPGVVSQLMPDRGAVIETTGAWVQCVWGNGRMDTGQLHSLLEAPEDILTPDKMDVSLRGMVLLAGHANQIEALQTAADLPARGLILGSMSTNLVPTASKMRFPIVVIEGFGHIPMNSTAFKLLTTNDTREVALNAERYDRFYGIRPEIIIPLPASGDPPAPRDADIFAPGQQVRMLRAPYTSAIGTIASLRPGIVTFPSGVRAPAAEIRLENGESALVPLANIEVLE